MREKFENFAKSGTEEIDKNQSDGREVFVCR